MLAQPRGAYLLLGVEGELDCHDPQQSLRALAAAQLVVALTAYRGKAAAYADVLLPIAPFTETPGSFVNTEGRLQSFEAAVKPLGEARPAWKVLRVLANLLELRGFDYDSALEVKNEVHPDLAAALTKVLDNRVQGIVARRVEAKASAVLERIGEVPIYQTDPIVRRAASLQKTRAALPPVAAMNARLLDKLNISPGQSVKITQAQGQAVLAAARDDGLPDGTVRVATAHPLTATLGSMFGEVNVSRVAQ